MAVNAEYLVTVHNEDEDSPATASSSSKFPSRTSGPLAPHNSYVGSTLDLDTCNTLLPSFDSRDMVNRIESKRSTLIDDDCSRSSPFVAGSVPFTPKNSFVDSMMDQYLGMAADSIVNELAQPDQLIEKVHQKKSLMMYLDDAGDYSDWRSSSHRTSEESRSDQKIMWTDDQGSSEFSINIRYVSFS